MSAKKDKVVKLNRTLWDLPRDRSPYVPHPLFVKKLQLLGLPKGRFNQRSEIIQKQKKKVKKDKIIIVKPQNKFKDISSSSKAIDNILIHILNFFCRC